MKDFTDKVVVITGGAAGIGRAMAQRFADAGAKLVLGDVEMDVLAETEAHFKASGVEVLSVRCDVSDYEQVQALGQAAMDFFGAVHIICNNAGVGGGGNSWETSIEEWRWVIDVDLWGVIYGIKTFVPLIIASGGGHVINTASAAGLGSVPFMGPYNVAKHGVVTLSETLYHELQMAHPEIGVTVVCPGWVKTGIAESARNKPDAVPASESQDNIAGVVAGFIEAGLDPSEVAEKVYEAVTNDKVYVLTHLDWGGGVIERARRIVAGENPMLVLPGME